MMTGGESDKEYLLFFEASIDPLSYGTYYYEYVSENIPGAV